MINKTITAIILVAATAFAGPAPIQLKCDQRENPLGVDDPTPPFSWQLNDKQIGAAQTAYQIQVATDEAFNSILWDSRTVKSRQSHMVPYAGKSLKSGQLCYWRIRYWDQNQKASDWSAVATFDMGLLNESDWTAKWIQPQQWEPIEGEDFERWCKMMIFAPEAVQHIKKDQWGEWEKQMFSRVKEFKRMPYFRKEITITKPIKTARLRYAALGYCQASVNGALVSKDVLDPAVRQYSQLVNYKTHDIKDQLKPGKNALGFILADGWCREHVAWPLESFQHYYNTPALLAQIEIVYTDGTSETVGTDSSWKQGKGGMMASNQYIGEWYDAREEPTGWNQAGFNDAAWKTSTEIKTLVSQPKLTSQSIQPQREIRKIKPVSVSQPQPGVWVFELPETVTGFIELNLPESQNSTVYVRPSEWTKTDKTPNNMIYPMRYPDGEIHAPTEGMIVAKRRASSIMSYGAGIEHAPIGVTTWSVTPTGRNSMTFKAAFSPHVMRYLEVTGLDFKPDLDTISAILVHNDIKPIHEFKSPIPVLNHVYNAAVSSFIQNTQSMSWDNAVERNQTTWPWTWAAPLTAAYGDSALLYRKFLEDQSVWFLPDGKTSGQTLSLRAYGYRSAICPIHESPAIDLPWVVLAYFGDIDAVREYYPKIRQHVDYYWKGQKGDDYLEGIRNWKPVEEGKRWTPDPKAPVQDSGDHTQGYASEKLPASPNTSRMLVTLGRWLNLLHKASWISEKLGEQTEKTYYDKLAEDIVEAIRESELRDQTAGTYGARRDKGDNPRYYVTTDGSPVGNGIAVWEGIARPDEYQKLADITFNDIQKNYTGAFPGGREWCRGLYLLSKYGYMDKATEFMMSTEHPAIGFYTEKVGLTTISESRQRFKSDILWDSTAQSESHWFANWYVELLCGIQYDQQSIGMQDFIIAPIIPSNLEYASLRTASPYGVIYSGWKHLKRTTIMEFTIPANSTARVTIPTREPFRINGIAATKQHDVKLLKAHDKGTDYRFPAGSFQVEFTQSTN